jgi:hypothetical protein
VFSFPWIIHQYPFVFDANRVETLALFHQIKVYYSG